MRIQNVSGQGHKRWTLVRFLNLFCRLSRKKPEEQEGGVPCSTVYMCGNIILSAMYTSRPFLLVGCILMSAKQVIAESAYRST